MKVFTVDMDHTVNEADALPAKVPLPTLPPGYSMQPPAQPIIVRKSRGYKGILLVMLAVFVMALFALMISEISYSRQRDENFFRLRWAELKHRLGYASDFHRERLLSSLLKERELMAGKATTFSAEASTISSTTLAPPLSSLKQAVQEQSRSSSSEQESSNDFGPVQDSRLQFLRKILDKIKQQAEDMGLNGTIQVSVMEVGPQVEEIHPHRFAGFPAPMSPSSLLDGFGEFHRQNLMENNNQAESTQPNFPFFGLMHNRGRQNAVPLGPLPEESLPFRPEVSLWSPAMWSIFPQQQQQQSQAFQPPVATQKQQPDIIPRPMSFDRWSHPGKDGQMPASQMASQQNPSPFFSQSRLEESGAEQLISPSAAASPLSQEDPFSSRVQRIMGSLMPFHFFSQQQFQQIQGEPSPLADSSNTVKASSTLMPIEQSPAQGLIFESNERLQQVAQQPQQLPAVPPPPPQDFKVLDGADQQQQKFFFFKTARERVQVEPSTPSPTIEQSEPAGVVNSDFGTNVGGWPSGDLGATAARRKEITSVENGQLSNGSEASPRGWAHQTSSEEVKSQDAAQAVSNNVVILDEKNGK